MLSTEEFYYIYWAFHCQDVHFSESLFAEFLIQVAEFVIQVLNW
jgi:hypothetical protein